MVDPTVPGLTWVLGHETFSAKTGTAPGNPEVRQTWTQVPVPPSYDLRHVIPLHESQFLHL